MVAPSLPQANPKQIWQATLGELQLQMTKATFETWVKPTVALSYQDGTMVVGVRNAYAKQWLENRLQGTIQRTLSSLLGCSVDTRFVLHNGADRAVEINSAAGPGRVVKETELPMKTGNSLPEAPNGSAPESDHVTGRADPAPVPAFLPKTREGNASFTPWRAGGPVLNPKHTFASYIVGNSNRLAHAACVAVSERLAEAYNPLFLYGGTGLGKTHLLEAVGWIPYLQGKVVVYVTSETFANELINSIRSQTTEEFRQAYRQADVLLIDDIQFIAGKETTQEEFFHTFNSLHASNKQIVISSDRHPRAIQTLEERLRSRFEGGLIADIQPPDLETRIAILRSKAEGQPVMVTDDVVEFIARKIQSNVREMNGALTRCIAYAQLMNISLTVELAMTILQDILRTQSVSTDQVLEAVAEFYHVTLDDLKGRSRNKEVVLPRQMAMFLLREETNGSLPQIGEALGGRDHTTVLYSVEKMGEEIEGDDQRRREMLSIKDRIYQGNRPKQA